MQPPRKKEEKSRSVQKGKKNLQKPPSWYERNYIPGLICAAVAFILYMNTFKNDYALDDYFAITINKIVQQGFHGIPQLLRTDFWQSAGKDLGYYRPLSLITFAMEYQFFGFSPHISHFINVLLFSITVYYLFLLLRKLFPASPVLFPVIITLLFAAHPLHTEVVANIKGRDELLSFLAVICMLYFALRYVDSGKIRELVLSLVVFYLGLLSKESAFAGIGLLPLAVFYYKKTSLHNVINLCLPFLGVIAIFFIQKTWLMGNAGPSLPDDPIFYPYRPLDIRYSSAFMMFLFYIRMIVFPHPLRYDYAFNQLPGVHWDHVSAIAGFILFFALIIIGAIYLRKKSPVGFAVAFFYITIIPAMGFVFLRGGIFAERLLYAPSLGFCIAITFLLFLLTRTRLTDPVSSAPGKPKSPLVLIVLCSVLFIGYSWKTVARNQEWKDNLTLVSAQHTSGSNSAQNHYQYGMLKVDQASSEQNPIVRDSLLTDGIRVLKQAISLVPAFPDAYFRLGYAYELRMMYHPAAVNTDTAIYFFTRAVETGPSLSAAYIHLGYIYNWMRIYDKAYYYYNEAQKRDPESEELRSKVNEIREKMKNQQGR
jgi:hypothetical protein